jgi:H+-transporting ATPase
LFETKNETIEHFAFVFQLSVADVVESPPFEKNDVILYAALCSKEENQDAIDNAILNEAQRLDLSSILTSYTVSLYYSIKP